MALFTDEASPLIDDPAPAEVQPDFSPAPAPFLSDALDMSQVDLALASTLLAQIVLPPICARWSLGFQFLLSHFSPAFLFRDRIRTFRFIPGDARPLFRHCYNGVLTLLTEIR